MPDTPGGSPLYEMARLGELFQQHRPRLEGIFRRRLGATGAVDLDVLLQDAFLDASRKWPAYQQKQPPLEPFVWLYGVVRDRLIETFRHASRAGRNLQKVPLSPDTSFQLGLHLAAPSLTPSRMLMRDEMIEIVQKALHMLSAEDRAIIEMHDYDGLKFAEIGARLDEKENTINKRYTRGIARLEKLLTELLGDNRP